MKKFFLQSILITLIIIFFPTLAFGQSVGEPGGVNGDTIYDVNGNEIPSVPGACAEQAWQCDGPGGKTTYTGCGVDICHACPSESLGYRTECLGQTGNTKSTSPKPKAKAVPNNLPQKTPNNTVSPNNTAAKDDTGKNYIYNIIDPVWWIQTLGDFVNIVKNTFNPIWFTFISSDFINGISRDSCWGMRCCTAPVLPGDTHKCSDCNKAFEPTGITGPDPYKGICNVDKVNGDTCQIIDCKK